MQASYGSPSSTSYINPASSFYNTTSYPYASLNSSRGLNPACKVSGGYITSSYSSPGSPFSSTAQPNQYSSYAATYGAQGVSSFPQGFSAQVYFKYFQYLNYTVHFYKIYYTVSCFQGVEYSSYGATYADSQSSQFASSYYAQSYSPYVSSPGSSGSIGTSSYQLTSSSILGKNHIN